MLKKLAEQISAFVTKRSRSNAAERWCAAYFQVYKPAQVDENAPLTLMIDPPPCSQPSRLMP
jgi:hypothetical protein